MTSTDVPDRTTWSSTSAPTLALGVDGQISWAMGVDDEMSDTERRVSPYGDAMVLRQVWSADHAVLRRLVVECDWQTGPLVFAETRRPRGGWRGDELARLLLSVLTFGAVVR